MWGFFSKGFFFTFYISECGIDLCVPCNHQIIITCPLVEAKAILIPAARRADMCISRTGMGQKDPEEVLKMHLGSGHQLKNQQKPRGSLSRQLLGHSLTLQAVSRFLSHFPTGLEHCGSTKTAVPRTTVIISLVLGLEPRDGQGGCAP